ncbi:hypothetical protein Mpsy_0687 [Methanolobus psychrophilus R15]|nr:hypothetical protein Mpsy_0687 [Methanolobus psychrophilus R15]
MITSENIDVLPFIEGSVTDAILAYKDNVLKKLETSNSSGAHKPGQHNRIHWK